jgi:hypothetical protein
MVKPNMNSVEVHPQLSNNRLPGDGALVGAGSLWPFQTACDECLSQTELGNKNHSLLALPTKAKILC